MLLIVDGRLKGQHVMGTSATLRLPVCGQQWSYDWYSICSFAAL